jgi:hypothetical protein
MRPTTALVLVAAAGAAAGVAWQLPAADTVRDVGVRLDLVEHGPLELRLGGALWDNRTLRDSDGGRDVAYVVRDAPLEVAITGREGRRLRDLVVRVDGQVVARRRLCQGATCPTRARVTLTPGVRARGQGLHKLTLLARGTRPHEAARSSFEVTVGRKLSVLEGEPVARRAGRRARLSVRRRASPCLGRGRQVASLPP